ncbi:MAG: hypothetical protein EBS64_05095 [Verrucomicrobia bacterium]|nr:hypothetical protein [Verrucomicrobiota bacterium]
MRSFGPRYIQLEGQCLGLDRAIAEAYLRLFASFELHGPFEPLRLVAGDFHQRERALRGDVARALDAASAGYGGDFHYDGITAADILKEGIGIRAVDGGSLDANGVTPTLRCATMPQRRKSDMASAIIPRHEIVVSLVRNPAVAVDLENLG